MNTGYYDLDKIINLNNSQLIACTSADYVIEPFLSNILKNVSVEQKIIIHGCGNYIKEKDKYSDLVINILVKGCRRK